MFNFFICPDYLRSICSSCGNSLFGPLGRFADSVEPFFICLDDKGAILNAYEQIANDEKADLVRFWINQICDNNCYIQYNPNEETDNLYKLGILLLCASHSDRYLLTHIPQPYIQFNEIITLYNIKLMTEYELRQFDFNTTPNFSHKTFIEQLILVIQLMLDGLQGYLLEDEYTDQIVRFLKSAGYFAEGQSRGGKSETQKQPGERDFIVRDCNNLIQTICEALRINSCGPRNKEIAKHLTKLITNYDNTLIGRKYFLIYAESRKFNELWDKYIRYMKSINTHVDFIPKSFINFDETTSTYSNNSNSLKTGRSTHTIDGLELEIFHFFINISSAVTH